MQLLRVKSPLLWSIISYYFDKVKLYVNWAVEFNIVYETVGQDETLNSLVLTNRCLSENYVNIRHKIINCLKYWQWFVNSLIKVFEKS